ncbi:MAG: LysE family translocator [Gammaproteobacteria bacterium]|nr:LysE family translocator [Gammaproteobacteria bacterium]MDH3767748.1 LysE family translocator [Gammaproteobacteria bacterium]
MSLTLWSAYVATVLLLMSTPGPSQLLMLSNSMGGGFPRSTATAAGDLSANLIQMIVAAAGLAGIIYSSAEVFLAIKWAGVAYLIYLGVNLFRKKMDAEATKVHANRSLKSLYWQGFVTSAANPKAVIFFAALFPQFLTPTDPMLPQFAVLSATYLLIDGSFLLVYGRLAGWISTRLQAHAGHFNRVAGLMLIAAAILLGLRSVERPGN